MSLFQREGQGFESPIPLQMYTVYILQSSSSGKHYIGFTKNLARRLAEHNANSTKSLKYKGPYNVIYTEEYPDRLSAHRRELQIKSYKGGNAFKKLLGNM